MVKHAFLSSAVVTRPRPRDLGVAARLAALLVGTLGLGAGCYQGPATADTDGQDGTGAGQDDAGDAGPDMLCEDGATPGALPRMVRLTHAQYDATIADLLGLPQGTSEAFLADAAVDGYRNNAEALTVTDRLARDYRRAAEQLAANFVSDPDRMAAVLPCAGDGGADAACAETLIRTLSRRAYRRPLTDAELTQYGQLYNAGNGLYGSGSSFEQGIRLVLEALLQSPHVLYRVELSSALSPTNDNLVPLDDFEIATRLSYLLWNSTPSDALLDAAEAGELSTAAGVETWARTLLADERAARPVQAFHEQWLELDDLDDLQKDPTLFPEFTPGLSATLREETERFIQRVALETHGTYADLMTSNVGFVNAKTAPLYGVAGDFPDDALVEVTLPEQERAGLLTQAGFLSAHAFTTMTSPIHRGVFVQRQLLCASIPPPPANVNTTLPPADGDLVTTRDRVDFHTSPPACQGCHSMINAPGYALEAYDAIGRLRDTDNGAPVDTKATLTIGADLVEIDGAVDLAQKIAQSETGPRCYLVNWFRYANMRRETAEDQCTIAGLHELMTAADYDIQEVLVAMTQTATFRFRSPLEVQ